LFQFLAPKIGKIFLNFISIFFFAFFCQLYIFAARFFGWKGEKAAERSQVGRFCVFL